VTALADAGRKISRYCLSLANGLELTDAAARAESIGYARDVMRMEPPRQDWSRAAL